MVQPIESCPLNRNQLRHGRVAAYTLLQTVLKMCREDMYYQELCSGFLLAVVAMKFDGTVALISSLDNRAYLVHILDQCMLWGERSWNHHGNEYRLMPVRTRWAVLWTDCIDAT